MSSLLLSFVTNTFLSNYNTFLIHYELRMIGVKTRSVYLSTWENLSHTTQPSSASAFLGFLYEIFPPLPWSFLTPPLVPSCFHLLSIQPILKSIGAL